MTRKRRRKTDERKAKYRKVGSAEKKTFNDNVQQEISKNRLQVLMFAPILMADWNSKRC